MVLKSGLLRKKENISTEKVHQFAMKRFTGAGWCNPSNIIYAEFGRFPIYLNSYTKCIRYWFNCPLCKGTTKDESHLFCAVLFLLFSFFLFYDLRQKFMPLKCYRYPNLF